MIASPPRKGRPNLPARFFAMLAVTMVIAGLVGAASVFLEDVDGVLGLLATVLAAVLAMLAALVGCVWWWRQADEAVREAHKWAWFWGGTAGMAVGGVILVTLVARSGDAGPTFLAGLDPANILYVGAMGMAGCQVVGYGVAWAYWWLARR